MYIAALLPWIAILLHTAITDPKWETRRGARIALGCFIAVGLALEL